MLRLKRQSPILCLITGGATTAQTTALSEEYARLLALVAAAVEARLDIIQLREKNLRPRVLYELTTQAAQLTRHSDTRLLVNDRADIARAAGADGVHLTTRSLEANVIRKTFGADFLIGVSTHSLAEARAARDAHAAFAVFGPVFDTPSKRDYGAPLGLESLSEAARALAPFPLIALGGINSENAASCLRAGACGVAGISLFSDEQKLNATAQLIRRVQSVS
ncbi:MAG: thiamine phosphate synthase [Pyrinomonadaceae bacterium]